MSQKAIPIPNGETCLAHIEAYTLQGHMRTHTCHCIQDLVLNLIRSDLHHCYTGLVKPHGQCYHIVVALVATCEPRPFR